MSDEDNSNRTMSDEGGPGSNQSEREDSIYGESQGGPASMTVQERERLLVRALDYFMTDMPDMTRLQGRVDWNLFADAVPGRSIPEVQAEMDRLFRDHNERSLAWVEGSRRTIVTRMQHGLEDWMEQRVEEQVEERLGEKFDEMLINTAGITRNELVPSANAALTHSQQLDEGEVDFDDEENDSGYEFHMEDVEDDEEDASGDFPTIPPILLAHTPEKLLYSDILEQHCEHPAHLNHIDHDTFTVPHYPVPMDGFQHREHPDFYPLPVNVPDFHSYYKKMVSTTTSVAPTPSTTLSPVWAAKHPPPPTDRKRSFEPLPVNDHPEIHSYNREMTDTATSAAPTASPTLGPGSTPKYPHPPRPLTDGESDKLGSGWKAKHPPPPTKREESSADVEKIVRSLMTPDQDDRPWQQPLEHVSPSIIQPVLRNDTVLGNGTASLPTSDCPKLPGHVHGPSVLIFTGIMLAALAISNFIMAMTVWYFVRRSTHRPWHTFTCLAADGDHIHTWRLPYHPNPLYIVLFFALIPFMIVRTLMVLPLVWIKYVTEARFGRRLGIDAIELLMPAFWKMDHCALCVPLEEFLGEEELQSPGHTRDYGWGTFARPSVLSGKLPAESHLSLI